MAAVSSAAFEAFRTAKSEAYEAARPIMTQGQLVEAENASTRAGLEAAAPLLIAKALERLHLQVRAALGENVARERKARDEGRDGDALLNAARVDAFDWVLQRLDEELGR
jgi:hypothetical protein